MCPLSTVQYTCEAQNDLQWKECTSNDAATYMISDGVNATDMAGVFNTVLTNISGNTLTSTATIASVDLTDDGRNITCRDDTGSANQQVSTVQLTGT